MFDFTVGNILDSHADALVNTVNCEGYMGKGIAYQFKLKFPHNNEEYVKACKNGTFKIGNILVFREEGKTILNFPTKDKWREKSKYEYIKYGMEKLKDIIPEINASSIAIPPLGCGNGGLEWTKVKSIIIEYLSVLEDKYKFEIYEPSKYYNSTEVKKVPKLNTSHLLLMVTKELLEKFNKSRLQKTIYLMTFFSNDNYFKFDAYNFGPYAHSIDILSRNIREYQKYYGVSTTDAIELIKKEIISDSVKKKYEFYMSFLIRAIKIINSISASNDLELITTILYIIDKKGPIAKQEIKKEIDEWSDYKSGKFDSEKINIGIEKLKSLGLIEKGLMELYPKRD